MFLGLARPSLLRFHFLSTKLIQIAGQTRGAITKVESITKKGRNVAYQAEVQSSAKHSKIQVVPDGQALQREEWRSYCCSSWASAKIYTKFADATRLEDRKKAGAQVETFKSATPRYEYQGKMSVPTFSGGESLILNSEIGAKTPPISLLDFPRKEHNHWGFWGILAANKE